MDSLHYRLWLYPQAAVPSLRDTKGSVVNITDIKGEKPSLYYTIYCTTKAALIMLTKSQAIELGPQVQLCDTV